MFYTVGGHVKDSAANFCCSRFSKHFMNSRKSDWVDILVTATLHGM